MQYVCTHNSNKTEGVTVWSGASDESATWELESQMRELYPQLFVPGMCEFRGRNSL